MRKSPDAFRTISEVAQELDLPQHVLRFWETRFSQIKPMKRGGGRRYYRPDDVELLRGIKHLLYGEGYTIKGVQRILKEQGVRHVIDAALPEGQAVPETLASDTPLTAVYDPAEPVQIEVERPPLVMPNQMQPAVVQETQPVAPPSQPTPQIQVSAPMPSAVAQPETVPQQPQLQAPLGQNNQTQPAPAQTQANNDTVPVQGQLQGGSVQPVAQAPQAAPIADTTSAAVHPAVQIQQAALASNMQAVNAPVPVAEVPVELPTGLLEGEPKFTQGQEASVSVEDGRAAILAAGEKGGFFSRLKSPKSAEAASGQEDGIANANLSLNKDDIRRLQSTLFELLECKRILDQARN